MKALLVLSRILVGGLFIFSGFVKAVDPLGFSYKLDEYFTVFGIPGLSAISLWLSMFICALEILLGIAVWLGTQLNKLAWILLLMIIFFTGLTACSAITGKVTDCGCFGEALTLTPWQTFAKDVILLVMIVIIFMYRHSITSLFKATHILTWGGGVLTLLLSLYCYHYLPVIDFRPYKVGNNIPHLMNDGIDPEYKSRIVYKNKNSGEVKKFAPEEVDELDSEVWEWQDTENIKVKEGKPHTIQDLVIEDQDGNDRTHFIVTSPSPIVLVVAYDLEKSEKEAFEQINEIRSNCEDKDIQFVGLTASPYKETNSFRQANEIYYDFYEVDATVLKTTIRSNPGLILLQGGTVRGKWPNTDLPTCEELLGARLKSDN
jgi:hypothetical protein